MAPPEDPDVGDSWLWYTWKLAGFPVAEEKMCTVRGEGTNVYIVVEDSQWNTNVDQADVDAMLEAWDNSSLGNWPEKGIYELTSENFGPVPDQLDNDPKVYVLYYDFDVNADGFFWAFDMAPDGTQSFASNETEVLYMNSSDFDPGGDYLISVQAHEFQHMIHWLADDNESSWVNEGCSELAMWLYGRPDDVVAFNANPDNNLTAWNGNFADYIKTYLWTLYLYEQYGGQSTILDLVSQPSNSVAGVEIALDNAGATDDFADAVAKWFLANYLDDPSLANGEYGYVGEDLPSFTAITRSSYPVPTVNATVNHWATDYIRFIDGEPLRLLFNGGDTSAWTPQVIQFQGGVPFSIDPIVLDASDDGGIDLPDFGAGVDEVVLVAGNVSSGGATNYSYETEGVTSSVSGLANDSAGLSLRRVGEHPFRSALNLELSLTEPASLHLTVHSVDGRELRTLHGGNLPAGTHSFVWDGRDAQGFEVAEGVYFMRAVTVDGRSVALRGVKSR